MSPSPSPSQNENQKPVERYLPSAQKCLQMFSTNVEHTIQNAEQTYFGNHKLEDVSVHRNYRRTKKSV